MVERRRSVRRVPGLPRHACAQALAFSESPRRDRISAGLPRRKCPFTNGWAPLRMSRTDRKERCPVTIGSRPRDRSARPPGCLSACGRRPRLRLEEPDVPQDEWGGFCVSATSTDGAAGARSAQAVAKDGNAEARNLLGLIYMSQSEFDRASSNCARAVRSIRTSPTHTTSSGSAIARRSNTTRR